MSSPAPERRKSSRPNRFGIGAIALIQAALLVLILVAVNYLSLNHHWSADLSRAADYSLSPASRNYLKDDTVRDREKPVKWIMAYRRSAPFYERVRALAEEYERRSRGGIELEVVDPLRSPDRMAEIVATYGITLIRDLVIIDARSDDSPPTREDENRIRTLHPKVRLVPADDMAVHATADGVRRVTGFKGEDLLTASLVSAIEGRSRVIALLADKSASSENAAGFSPRAQLEEILRYQNVVLADLNLSQIAEIPEEVDGIAMVAPNYDLTEQELAVLERYWNRPKAAMFMLLDDGTAPPKLRAFLRGMGVTPRGDRVIARSEGRLVTQARGTFTRGVPFMSGLAGLATEFSGAISSLEVREGAEDLLNRRIAPFGLIEAAAGFWGETDFGSGDDIYDEIEDHGPPLHLAAAVIRGAESDDRFAADSSRMIVMSGIDFLDPAQQRAENRDFLASAANWLVGREQLAGIGPRALHTYKLPLLDAQVSFINRANLFFLPALFLLIGGFVWSSRRV
ncbi:MAG TPA: Gldg family protein [Luteolibacter sp.]|nr:Gldg family protein [Luteolibacter sp.]